MIKKRIAVALLAFCAFILAAATLSLAEDNRPYIGTKLGMTQERLVNWLKSHEYDGYYVGTRYEFGPIGSPNGDPYFVLNEWFIESSPASVRPGMNCAGFVAHVMCKSGLDRVKWCSYMAQTYSWIWSRQKYDAGSADMWYLYVTGDTSGLNGMYQLSTGVRYYSYPSVAAALNSGVLVKGDILILWPRAGYAMGGKRVWRDSHMCIFWGDTPDENKVWHSIGIGNVISALTTKLDEYDVIVVPISAPNAPEYGKVSVTQTDVAGKELSGAIFTLTDSAGNIYKVGPTGKNGTATSGDLPVGKYTMKITTYPSRYMKYAATTWNIQVEKNKTTSVKSVCQPQKGALGIKVTDAFGKGVAGVVYHIWYNNPKMTGSPSAILTTDKNGVAEYGKNSGVYALSFGSTYYGKMVSLPDERNVFSTGTIKLVTKENTVTYCDIKLKTNAALTLSSDMPKGTYKIYTNEKLTIRASWFDRFGKGKTLSVESGASVYLPEGTYWLIRDDDAATKHDVVLYIYKASVKSGKTLTLTPAYGERVEYVRHRKSVDFTMTAPNALGFEEHYCGGCGEYVLFGDVDDDGKLNARDVITLMKIVVAGLRPEYDASRADMNGDGKTNASDVIELMTVVSGR